MKILSLILLVLPILLFAQVKEIENNFKGETYSSVKSIIVPNSGVIVMTSSQEKIGNSYKFSIGFTFYGANLEEKWTQKDVVSNSFTVEEIRERYSLGRYTGGGKSTIMMTFEESYKISRDGKYFFFVDQMRDGDFYQVSLLDGKSQLVELDAPANDELIQIKCGIGDDSFYLVRTLKSEGKTNQMLYEIFSVDIETLKIKKSKGMTPPNKTPKSNVVIANPGARYWDIVGIGDKGFYLADNYGQKDKDKGIVSRRVLRISADGEFEKEVSLKVLDKVLYTYHIGDFYFNRFGEERFYSFSMSKKEKEKSLIYCEYDTDLNLIWSEVKPTGIIPGKGDFTYNIFQQYEVGATIEMFQKDTRIFQKLEIEKRLTWI